MVWKEGLRGVCGCVCSGLTATEQFLAQVCNPQSARFNGQNIASSLLQSTNGQTDNALICCVACLDSVSASLEHFLPCYVVSSYQLDGMLSLGLSSSSSPPLQTHGRVNKSYW